MMVTEQGTIGVISVDDNPLIGESLERLVETYPDLRWDGAFLSGEGVSQAAADLGTTVILLDLEIPGTDTCALVVELTQRAPHARVIILSAHMEGEGINQCLASGAAGYIGKHRPLSYVLDAVHRAAAGEFVICDDAAKAAGLV
jgi:DNA-binding NarL/FixJ family response regulator